MSFCREAGEGGGGGSEGGERGAKAEDLGGWICYHEQGTAFPSKGIFFLSFFE